MLFKSSLKITAEALDTLSDSAFPFFGTAIISLLIANISFDGPFASFEKISTNFSGRAKE